MKTNQYEVLNKKVCVIDDFLQPHQLIFIETLVNEVPYKINQVSSRLFSGQNASKTRPASHFGFNDVVHNPVILEMSKAVNNVYPGYNIEKAYVNFYNLGTTALPHVDKSDETDNSLTALLFVSSQWQMHWGGGFLICSEDGSKDIHITYKENRMVVFDGSLLHMALPLSVMAEKDRFTLAIKMVKA